MNSFGVGGLGPSESPESNHANNQKCSNHWKDIVFKYERRNASLENRQAQLSERLRAMECALPSMLMSAMVSMHYGTDPPKLNLESVLSKSAGVTSNYHQIDSMQTRENQNPQNADDLQVEIVYKREEDCFEPNQESRDVPDPENSCASRFATGDDGCDINDGIGETVMNLSIMSSRDLIALGRIQELAEQERLLKRYILDLESRERTFCETLERANKLLNDPLECLQECLPFCPGAEMKEPISDDPVMQRLQKLEFYNKKMITSMKGLRQEKNMLIKQTELLKSELKNTQEKLGEVQKEVLGESKVIPVMTEALFTRIEPSCSCTSTSNKENNSIGENSSPKTLEDLAEQFENVLQKAKNHGLCKLTGTIKDAATKLKELSKSEEASKCICDCPCDPTFKQDGSCPNCKCGKFDLDKFGETGDWFCDSCGGECVCDLVSLDEDNSLDTIRGKNKNCECGCQDDKIACECDCGMSKINEVGEAGDIPKTVARKVSEDLVGIICKDCGNCKCGDDHSQCPDCVQACTCSCTVTDTESKSLPKPKILSGHIEREPQDPDVCGPRCACNDSDGVWSPENRVVGELGNEIVLSSENERNSDSKPCEQPEHCDICLEEGSKRLDQSKTIVKSRRTDDARANEQKIHDSNCPCSWDATLSENECLCGCGVAIKVDDEDDQESSCPCGCGQTMKRLNDSQKSGCDCECAKGEVHCDNCCCIASIQELLNVDKPANTVSKSPETCPCIEESMRDLEMEKLAKTLQQDVESIGKKNNLLRQLVDQCACTAPEIIEDSCPAEGCLYHDPAPIRPTISGLQAAIELLRVKNRRKDEMIAVLAENIRGTVDPGNIIENLATPIVMDISEDFDHCKLYNYLRGSEFDDYLRDETRNGDPGKCTIQNTEAEIPWFQSLVPAPRDFKVVEQICNDCLLVSWTAPNDVSTLNGYEILVNGHLVNRVSSPTRTEALLVSLDTSRPAILTLYSLGPRGSSSDPVRITYPACPCIQE